LYWRDLELQAASLSTGRPDVPPLGAGFWARAGSATAWTTGGLIAQVLLRLASNLLMTRLLMPEAFGMLAFAVAFLTAMQLMTDVGIRSSIIRETDGTDARFLRVAWTVKLLRSGVAAVGVLCFAGLVALLGGSLSAAGSVLREPQMPLLVAMVAMAPLLDGLASTNLDVQARRMAFRRVVLIEVVGRIVSIMAMAAFATLSPTVWALLCGMLVGNLVPALLSHVALPGPRMRLAWDTEIAGRLWRFGRWIIGSSTMTFVARNADTLIFGAAIPGAAFGLYAIAQIWIGLGQMILDTIIGKVGLPAVAEVLRDRPADLRRTFRRMMHLVDAACVALFVAAVVLGPAVLGLLYPADFDSAGALVPLLAPLFLSFRFRMLGNLLLAQGDSRTVFLVALIGAGSTLAGLLFGLRSGGLEGAIAGLTLARLVPIPILLGRAAPILGRGQVIHGAAWLVLCAAAVAGVQVWA
jgi:O-antigen/teichoic acid export membrane protein